MDLKETAMPKYIGMAVLMEEQEAAGKKDKYIEITDTLLMARTEVNGTEEKCGYLKALIDTLCHMDFQIYELYRKLQDTFKAVLKELLDQYESLSEEEKHTLSDAVSKGCGLGILLEEKYRKYKL